MAWFEAFRNQYGFASYQDNRSPVSFDIPLLTVTYLCVLVSIATLIATLGIRGRERWSVTMRAIYAVAIGSIILVCLVGYEWQEGSVKVKSHYVYRNNFPFEGRIGVKVGLNTVNVTLDGYYRGTSGPGYVYYAESMPCNDFGTESASYDHFLHKGLPAPILKVMEFLTIDQGSLRWGRSFHASGYFAMSLLWASFAFWIVSNVLLCSVIVYGAYMFTLTGLTMVLACVTYHVCQCPLALVISFGEESLRVSYSWCFWLTLVAGGLTFILGLLLVIVDHLAHAGVSEFFHLENLTEYKHFENDYRQADPKQEPYFWKDRRGSTVPPPLERRESIFLDQCRPPGFLQDVKTFNFSSLSNLTIGEVLDRDGGLSKLNPLFNDDGMKSSTFERNEDDTRVQMERVCDDLQVCLSTKKPSLATLKEHRENHANERLSTSTGRPASRYVRQGHGDRRVSCQDGIFTFGNLHQSSRRRGSCPDIVSAVHLSIERSILEVSECDSEEQCHSNAPHEVIVCIESEQNSREDSTSTRSSFVECSPRGSDEGINSCVAESHIGHLNNSQSSCDVAHDDVFVKISS